MGHDENTCRSYELMMDRTPTYRVQTEHDPFTRTQDDANNISGARTRPRWRRTWKGLQTTDMLQLQRARTLCP